MSKKRSRLELSYDVVINTGIFFFRRSYEKSDTFFISYFESAISSPQKHFQIEDGSTK